MKHHLVRYVCDAREARIVYIRTEDQHTDLFAKPLDMQKFSKHTKTALIVVMIFKSWVCCKRWEFLRE